MPNTLNIKDATGSSQPMQVIQSGGNFLPQHVLADSTGASISTSNPLTVTESLYSYKHINSAGTTVVKAAAGALNNLSVNLKATSSTCTVYDSTTGSGTVIAVIDTVNFEGTFNYNVAFSSGLTLVVTGSPDITVSYR